MKGYRKRRHRLIDKPYAAVMMVNLILFLFVSYCCQKPVRPLRRFLEHLLAEHKTLMNDDAKSQSNREVTFDELELIMNRAKQPSSTNDFPFHVSCQILCYFSSNEIKDALRHKGHTTLINDGLVS